MSIPLTIDWLTLAWLETRLSLWWRARAVRWQLGLLLSLGALSGCVPAVQLEESQSAAQVEKEGRRRSELQQQQLAAENEQLRAQVQQEKQALDEREQALSQAALDTSTQGKQREDAESLVEQLRGELARVGGHLQAFHDDKAKLEQLLSGEAAHGRALARLTRDVALSLGEPLAAGEYALDVEQGLLTLRVPRDKLVSEDGSVKPEAAQVLEVVSRLMQLHKQAKLRVEDSSAPADAVRVAPLVTALGERGVAPERFQPLAADAVAVEEAGTPDVVFAFSEP